MKKRFTVCLLALFLILTLVSCGEKTHETEVTDDLPTVTDGNEYILYQNIFYNQTGDNYVGNSMTKKGVLTKITDSFSDMTRYYVWGYYDNTKCCDWQWELKLSDDALTSLPPVGSLISVTGIFNKDDNALDGYWLTDVKMTVKKTYSGPDCDLDLTTMNATLERVQMANIQYYPEKYEGKSLYVYGRMATPTSIQNPYYNGSWTQEIKTVAPCPAIGTMVIVNGRFESGIFKVDTVRTTTKY